MKIRRNLIFVLTGFIAFVLSCSCNNNAKDANLAPNAHKVKAQEVIQTSNYTYVRVSENDKDYWCAIERAEIREGGTYYWSQGAEMNEFTSKELKRTFRSIFFIQDFTDKPITSNAQPAQKPLTSMAGKQTAPEYPGIVVPKAQGGVTVAELYAGEKTYNGKNVKVSGKVVKFSAAIMKKNWVHIQDGTKANGKYDLTVTTQDSVKVGDIVTFEGVAAFNKDVGAGYFYEVLIVDAKLKK
jgi:hypothetical protein